MPCYNEEATLPYLIKSISSVKAKLPNYRLDLLLVNDGSIDETQTVIEKCCLEYPYIYYRQLAENSGHQSALRAGLNSAVNYDAAVMMDADMQHPPEMIPVMVEAWEKGGKIVQMVRNDTATDVGVVKYLASRSYYVLINILSDLKLKYGASDFRLIDKLVTRQVVDSRENDLFLRGYFSSLRVPKQSVFYKPNKRVAGATKYTSRKMLHLAYQGIMQFSERPLQIAMVIGGLLAGVSFAYGVALTLRYLMGNHVVSGWTSLTVTILFCFGINFVLIGIVGAYLTQALRLEKQRPEFIVAREKLPSVASSSFTAPSRPRMSRRHSSSGRPR